ncbi:MAG: hypothetical protein LBN36_03300, partial [Clostridiales Family XIII bacterium]|nr:hypothetical protein [Clostridiales Family XIII bacterium]
MSGGRFLFTLIPVFASVTFLYCLIPVFTRDDANVPITFDFFVFFACALISTLVNCILSMKEHALGVIATVNVLLIILTEAAVFSAPNTIVSLFSTIIIGMLLIIPIMTSLLLSRQPIKA